MMILIMLIILVLLIGNRSLKFFNLEVTNNCNSSFSTYIPVGLKKGSNNINIDRIDLNVDRNEDRNDLNINDGKNGIIIDSSMMMVAVMRMLHTTCVFKK